MRFHLLYNFYRNILRKQQVDDDLDEEIQSYVELLAEEKTQCGVGRDEAIRRTRLEVGGSEQLKESVRDVRVGVTSPKWK